MDNFRDNILSRTFEFSVRIVKMVSVKGGVELSFVIIYKQLVRSATSIGANIVEAQGGSSKKDFINYINHSFKSAKETIYWLKLLKATTNIHNGDIDTIISEADEIVRIIASSLISLRKNLKK